MSTLLRQLFVAVLGGIVAAGVLLVVNNTTTAPRLALAQTSLSIGTPGADDPAAPTADARRVINYQGQVFNPNGGAPYVNAGLNFRFRLFNDSAATNMVYFEDKFIITNADGFFSTQIGDLAPFGDVTNIFNGQELYLRVIVNDQELAPLQPITFVPYAFWSVSANDADELDGYDAGDFPKIIAHGVVNADGTKRSGSGYSVSLQNVEGATVYVISLDDAPNHSVDDYTTIVTPACLSPAITGIGTSLGDLVVDVWDQNGNRILCTFQFMTLEQ